LDRSIAAAHADKITIAQSLCSSLYQGFPTTAPVAS
jgi:hypothetical protein